MNAKRAWEEYEKVFSACINTVVNASDEEFVGNRPTLEDIDKAVANVDAAVAACVAEARAPLVEALETGLFQLEIYPNHVYRELGKGRRGKRGWCDLCDALDDVRAALAAKETP